MMRYGVELYVRLDRCVCVENPEIVPFMFHARWCGQDRLKSGISLVVSHPQTSQGVGFIVRTHFNVLHWLHFDISQKVPCRRVFLGLATSPDAGPMFGMLEFDLGSPGMGGALTLSPVPFGTNGKPTPPPPDLLVAAAIVMHPQNFLNDWDARSLEAALGAFCHSDMRSGCGRFYLNELTTLGVCSYANHGHARTAMTPGEFEEIFGVNLPEIKSKETAMA